MIKCTALFQLTTNTIGDSAGGPHIAGWSESWYKDSAIDAAATAFEALCGARSLMLPGGAAIVGQRYQIIGGGSSTGGRRFPGITGVGCDVPQMSLLCTSAGSGVANVRRFTLRGIPDGQVVEGEFRPNDFMTGAFNTYKTRLGEGAFKFRARDIAAPTARVAHIEAGVLTLMEDLVANVGDFVQIRKAVNQSGKNVSGRYQILTKTSNQLYTIRGFPTSSIVDLNGFASVYTIIYPTVTALGTRIARATTRKVGRPFESYRGRSSRR